MNSPNKTKRWQNMQIENKVTMQSDPCITNVCQVCSRKLQEDLER